MSRLEVTGVVTRDIKFAMERELECVKTERSKTSSGRTYSCLETWNQVPRVEVTEIETRESKSDDEELECVKDLQGLKIVWKDILL